MNEYAHENAFKRFVRLMTNNLAGVPSIVFGLFGMAFFVNGLGFGVSILSGCLTLGILILPIIIRTTEESLKFIEEDYRLASYALGASKWQTIWKVILACCSSRNFYRYGFVNWSDCRGNCCNFIYSSSLFSPKKSQAQSMMK